MPAPIIDTFFALLRYSLDSSAVIPGTDPGSPFTEPLTAEQWKAIFFLSKKQSLLGVIYSGVKRLPAELQPPADLMQQWTLVARRIMATNNLMNATAAKLTQMFAEKGRKTVILKGQANALLYPDPYLRQAGDIDILVEGGRKRVADLLKKMNLFENADDHLHHIVLDSNLFNGVVVEVHYSACYSSSPLVCYRMRKFLLRECEKEGALNLVTEGFFVPPKTFALMTQMSHLFHHVYEEGFGLRQLVDFYLLIRSCSRNELLIVRSHMEKMGLFHMAGALMWLLEFVFHIDSEKMLCPPDKKRGKQLLEEILAGGNFGKYSKEFSLSAIRHWIANRKRAIKRLNFDFSESIWHEIFYPIAFVTSVPCRIKFGKISFHKKRK